MKIKIKPYTFKVESAIAKAIQKAIDSSEISRLIVNNFDNFVSILGGIVLPTQAAKKAAAEEEERRQVFELFKILYKERTKEIDLLDEFSIERMAQIAVGDTKAFNRIAEQEREKLRDK
ncbi:hypothetical protein [Okeania sp. SIO2B3]|uniref:hypothetical protein n=1 Tax=Okeania sp. SIO2B3 TaxID=2607784 RepID=UPI0013C0D10F|nr:hypothetical protein [Okeania sp. SIO2B3]NET40592.1 hypothetical protein [Okeania sp. SIO2B3]